MALSTAAGASAAVRQLRGVGSRLRPVPWGWVAGVASAAAAAWFAAVAIDQWRDFQANAYDLAIFDQVVWNTSRGQWFETTFVSYGSYMGQHFSPILAIFAPAYLLGAGALFLTVVQALGAALAAVPLYAAARRFGVAAAISAALAVAYLLNAYLHRAIVFDFHPETLIALPVFLAAWAAADRRFVVAGALAASALLFKEDSVFVALALAALIAWQGGRWHAAAVAAFALAWTVIGVGIVMPDLRQGAPNDLLPRYGYLAPGATSEADILDGVLLHPWRLVQAFTSDGRAWTTTLFVLATAPLALWRPWWAVIAAPGLALAVFSASQPQRDLEFHYAVQVVPLALLALVLAARDLQRRLSPALLCAGILVPALAGFFALSPLSPFAGHRDTPSERHLAALQHAVSIVPPGESVSAQSSIVPRLSQRPVVDEFPGRSGEVEWVIVDRFGPISTSSQNAGFADTLQEVRRRMHLVYERDGVEVYHR